jgi:hypothetical protein
VFDPRCAFPYPRRAFLAPYAHETPVTEKREPIFSKKQLRARKGEWKMHIGRTVTCIAAAALALCMLTPPQARADEWNQKTIFTFSQPVEVPGRVLEPGTYVFKLLDSQSDRNIVEVFDRNEQHLYGTFLAIPNYRLQPTGRVILTFKEREAGAPEAVKAWFYPGENYGHEFVYGKSKALAMAQTNQTQVAVSSQAQSVQQPPATPEPETPMAETTPVPQQEAQAAPPPPVTESEPQANREAAPEPAPAPQVPPAELPHTGSDLPLVALIGTLSFIGAGSLRFATAKLK